MKNAFTLEKVLRGTMQIMGLQNNRWEDVFILHWAQYAGRWKTDSQKLYYSTFPQGSLLHKLLNDCGEWVIYLTSKLKAQHVVKHPKSQTWQDF